MKNNYLGQAWLILLLSLCFGAALAGVQIAWGPRIEQNKEDDARSQVPALVPGAEASLTPPAQDIQVSDAKGRRVYHLYRAMKPTGEKPVQIGWVIKATGPGYADDIEVLIGLDLGAGRITGLSVLAQNETPGLGSKITKPKWLRQFAGKSTAVPLEAVKKGRDVAGNHVRAVSGATISSESVCNIVNQALADLRPRLAAPDRKDTIRSN